MTKIMECKLIQPVMVEKKDTIVTVAQKMVAEKVKHVIVVENQMPVGIVSMHDIVTRLVAQDKDARVVTAADIMTHPIDSLEESMSIEHAFMHMVKKNVFFMPITREGKLVGLLPFSNQVKAGTC